MHFTVFKLKCILLSFYIVCLIQKCCVVITDNFVFWEKLNRLWQLSFLQICSFVNFYLQIFSKLANFEFLWNWRFVNECLKQGVIKSRLISKCSCWNLHGLSVMDALWWASTSIPTETALPSGVKASIVAEFQSGTWNLSWIRPLRRTSRCQSCWRRWTITKAASIAYAGRMMESFWRPLVTTSW